MARSGDWPLTEFTQDVLPKPTSSLVLIGPPGPTQQITVRLQNDEGRILGYLKYADKENIVALSRLRQEWFLLTNLPPGVGPEPLKFGELYEGEALLTSPVPGASLRATLPPPDDLVRLLNSLVTGPPVPLESHPWARGMRDLCQPEIEALLDRLSNDSWPVAIQHGDFAPWNLLRKPDGTLRAIDWERGKVEGFPHLDLLHYILQTSALIYRRPPLKAVRFAVRHVSGQPGLGLNSEEAHALVRLAAYDSYRTSLEDGLSPEAYLQAWRRTVWSSPVLNP